MDITLANFEADLINASLQQPVLLDIWAPWCGPCKALGPVLEKLEVAYAGRFKLAKLNSDEQPEIAGQLSQAFGVRSIPFCVLFDRGQPVDGFVGALPEAQVRAFLDKHVPSTGELEAEAEIDEAAALIAEGDPEAALDKLQQAVAIDPANDDARFDYVKLLLERGQWAHAEQAFAPVASKAVADVRLDALGRWLAAGRAAAGARSTEALAAAIAANKRDFEARFELAQTHFAAGRFTQAMDELLEIVMRDKAWNQEAARKTYVAILTLMSKPVARPAAAEPAKGKLEVTGKAVPRRCRSGGRSVPAQAEHGAVLSADRRSGADRIDAGQRRVEQRGQTLLLLAVRRIQRLRLGPQALCRSLVAQRLAHLGQPRGGHRPIVGIAGLQQGLLGGRGKRRCLARLAGVPLAPCPIGQQTRREAPQAIAQRSVEVALEECQRLAPARLRGEHLGTQHRHQRAE